MPLSHAAFTCVRYLYRAGRGRKSQTCLPVREEWQVGRRRHMHVLMLTFCRPPLEDCCGLQAPSSPTRDSILIPQSDHRPTINVHCDGSLPLSCSSIIEFCLLNDVHLRSSIISIIWSFPILSEQSSRPCTISTVYTYWLSPLDASPIVGFFFN